MKIVEIYIDGDQVFDGDAGVEADAYEPFADENVVGARPSLFGDEHITVAEMVRRVQLHGELVRALRECVKASEDIGIDATLPVLQARVVLAKVKP